jgi:hypothetical protein
VAVDIYYSSFKLSIFLDFRQSSKKPNWSYKLQPKLKRRKLKEENRNAAR